MPAVAERSLHDPLKVGPISKGDQASQGSLGVRYSGVEEDAGSGLLRGPCVNPLGETGRVVAALQGDGAEQQVREGVQSDVPRARPVLFGAERAR